MLSDTAIAAYFVRRAVKLFHNPQSRRELARELRRIRVESGAKAARLVLAYVSARNLQG